MTDHEPLPETRTGPEGAARASGTVDSLDHVQLAAPPGSEDALRAFYSGVLGMEQIPKPPVLAARGGCWFAAGTAVLHLGVEKDFRPAEKAHPGIRVRGIDEFAERLRAGGADVVWDDDFPGHRRFYSFDPVGNRLEFLEPSIPEPSD
ncbi:VOC family protein [Streptomyces marispadix]|uniref:Glyoxalase n=1 Tax=Streptomyces marispadix TaxID=2922868 RepID=A0ABS9SX04_9ACTN|nr:VOC family protein [Streptomyces marispadix]MCH6160723.1 glyoxalase [Streptomyces marispadix]